MLYSSTSEDDLADSWKSVSATWKGDMTFLGVNEDGGTVQMGTLDGNPGIGPMQLILVGLAGCTGMDIVAILKKKRAPLEGLKVNVRGIRAETYPRVYTEIEVEYLFWGEGLDPRHLEQAIKLSEDKYCSVSIMLGKTAKIHSRYKILKPGEAEG